jgi:hypothetical protein
MLIIHLKEALSVLFPEFGKVFRQLDSKAFLDGVYVVLEEFWFVAH